MVTSVAVAADGRLVDSERTAIPSNKHSRTTTCINNDYLMIVNCCFIAYFRSLEMSIAVAGASVLADLIL